MPARFFKQTLEDYEVRPGRGDPNARAFVSSYLDELPRWLEVAKGLFLVGPPGTGKTMLACIAGRAAKRHQKTVAFMPLADYITKLIRLISLSKVMFGDGDATEEWFKIDTLIQSCQNVFDVLILDDVGKQHGTDSGYAEYELDFLLRHRFNLGLTTHITSNQRVEEWGLKYSESMQSFLHEICHLVPVVREDARKCGS